MYVSRLEVLAAMLHLDFRRGILEERLDQVLPCLRQCTGDIVVVRNDLTAGSHHGELHAVQRKNSAIIAVHAEETRRIQFFRQHRAGIIRVNVSLSGFYVPLGTNLSEH